MICRFSWRQEWIISLVLIALVSIFVAGCDTPEDENESYQLRFRLALELKPETRIWDVSRLFKEKLEAASAEHNIKAGEIKVDFYDQGSIGTERQLLEAAKFGVVEVVQVNTAVVTTIEPSYAILNLPYLFETEAHHQRALNGAVGTEMLEMLRQHELLGLGFYSAGFRSIFHTFPAGEDCPDTPAGYAGLKIRVMESRTMISTMEAMGVSAVPIPFSELYQGIKTGVVDGAENSPKVFTSYKYEEAGCNCFTLTEHSTDQHVLIANEKWLESLDTKYKERILQVSRQIIPVYNAIWEETISEALQDIKKANVQVNVIGDKTPFVNSTEGVHMEFFNRYPEVSRSLYEAIKSDKPTQ